MGHLNELQEKYQEKGLSLLAVSGQGKGAVEGFVEEFQVKYPTACVSAASMQAYSTGGVPHAYLIGANGRILWHGHPGELPDATIEEHLENVRLLPDWPEALKAPRKAFLKLKYADALLAVEKLIEGAKLEEADVAPAEQIRDWLTWYGQAALENAAADVEKGLFYEASLALEEVSDLYKRHDLGKQADAALKELLSDKERKLEVKAGEKLAKLMPDVRDASSPEKALKALRPMLSKKYRETAAGKKAAELAAQLEEEAAR